MTDPALEVRGLRASHPGTVVLQDVDLTVAPGALTAVLGPSGCGKTTLLRVVAGFHAPDAGSVHLGGRAVSGPGVTTEAPEHRRVGLVPQDGALFEHLTVAGNVGFGLRDRGRADRRERVAAMLDLVGLADLAGRRPRELSGGQQQRVALARALAPRPRLVLLDEPFSALDAGLRQELREEVRHVLRAAGAAAVLVTHDRAEALGLADRLVVLRAGRVVADGDPRTVYRDPPDADVALLVGEGVVLDARREGDHADTDLGRLAVRGPGGGAGRVVVRPEQLVLVDDPSAVRLAVREVLFGGPTSTVVLALPDGGSLRLTTGGPVPEPGAVVGVAVSSPVRWLGAEPTRTAEPEPAVG